MIASWEGTLALSTCLRSAEHNPDDTSQWLFMLAKPVHAVQVVHASLFMLAKCELASLHCLRWHETLKLVKSRLQHWANGDLSSLWSEALGQAVTGTFWYILQSGHMGLEDNGNEGGLGGGG